MNQKPKCKACLLEQEIVWTQENQSLPTRERVEKVKELRQELQQTAHEHPTKSKLRSS